MNTPKTPKPPKRWKDPQHRPTHKYGSRLFGIMEANTAAAYGMTVSYWPHVEEQIILMFEELMSGKPPASDWAANRSARQIFRSIISQKLRINIMRSMLEELPHNKDKPSNFDEIIDEFCALNGIRNDLVHGLWWYSSEQAVLYSATEVDEFEFDNPRVRTGTELLGILARMRDLVTAIHLRNGPPA